MDHRQDPWLRDIKASSEDIKERFGIFGDISVVGMTMGMTMGIVAGFDFVATAQLAIELASVLVVLPRMLSIIAEGIIPIPGAPSAFMKRCFPGRELYAAVVPATLVASQLAPICTTLCANTGMLTDQIAAGALFTNWEEEGNLLLWVMTTIAGLFA